MIETALAMPVATYATFLVASLLLYLTPGSDMMFTIASGIRGGPRAGVAAALGICTGVLCHVLLAAVGLAALMAAHPDLLDGVRYAGAAYLLWLAWQAWRDDDAEQIDRWGREHLRAAFGRGFVTNMLNPKVGLFVLAFLPQFTDPSLGPVVHQILILGALLVLGGIVTDVTYGIAAGAMADRIRRHGRRLSKLSALLFAALAARIVID